MVLDHPNLADSQDLASQLVVGAGLCWEIAVNVVNKVDPMKHWIMSSSVCALDYQIHICCLFFSLRLKTTTSTTLLGTNY
jgi:hypothetical protein